MTLSIALEEQMLSIGRPSGAAIASRTGSARENWVCIASVAIRHPNSVAGCAPVRNRKTDLPGIGRNCQVCRCAVGGKDLAYLAAIGGGLVDTIWLGKNQALRKGRQRLHNQIPQAPRRSR